MGLAKRFPIKILVVLFFSALLSFSCSNSTEDHDKSLDRTPPETVSLLGDTLYRPILPDQVYAEYNKKLEDTRLMYKANPKELTNIIWYGRRLAYVGRYNHAIEIFTRGLEHHPESFRILRHRGHRYITLRQFDRAIADLTRAAVLATGSELEIEPDGLPNRLNQPLTTVQWNIYYHLGLAHYLKGDYEMALEAYKPCLALSDNHDVFVAVTDWMYLTYHRLNQADSADAIIGQVSPDWEMIENESYFKRIMLHKGLLPPDSLLQIKPGQDQSLELATQGYGLGNFYLIAADTSKALKIFTKVVRGDNWPAFGYIAAEADLARFGN
jgi:tetratricopeptide (TPR) repeat protein